MEVVWERHATGGSAFCHASMCKRMQNRAPKNRRRLSGQYRGETNIELPFSSLPPFYAGIAKCRGGDLNPYALRRQILSLVRLPISPPRPLLLREQRAHRYAAFGPVRQPESVCYFASTPTEGRVPLKSRARRRPSSPSPNAVPPLGGVRGGRPLPAPRFPQTAFPKGH